MGKRQYFNWTVEDMENAIDAFKKKLYGFNECCRRFNIPKPTFRRHLLGQVKRPLNSIKKNGVLPTFSKNVEEELVKHLLTLEECFFGLNITDVRRLAYQVAEKNDIPHKFNSETKLAGKKWFYAFRKRHPDISMRQPENISLARCKGFNREAVDNFFNILEEIVKTDKIDATGMFNVDESGFSTVQKKCSKVLGKKGKKRIGRVVSGERGTNTTLVCCTSATGLFVPPMIIFKRKRMTPGLGKGAPPGSIIEVSDKGYINSELFVKWLQHFINVVKPTKQNKVLLLLDGHTTHTKNLYVLELAQAHGVILLQLPGHTTHRLQPLDVGIFGPMQKYYDQSLDQWMTCNPGQCVTQFDVCELIGKAYNQSASIANAVSAFRNSGCWPINRLIFNDSDFAASDLLNRNVSQENQMVERTDEESITTFGLESTIIPECCDSNSLKVPIQNISPIPVPTTAPGQPRKEKAQEATVLTSKTYKAHLETVKTNKLQLTKSTPKQASIPVPTTAPGQPSKENPKEATVLTSKTNKPHLETVETNKLQLTKSTPKQASNPVRLVNLDNDDWTCLICNKNVVQDMIKCVKCEKWAHEICAGITEEECIFYCSFCSLL